MSLGIAFKGAEGIVLAVDSRVTLTATNDDDPSSQEVLQGYYDNAVKLLRVNGQEFVGAVTYGAGAIGQQSPRTAHSYLPEFEALLSKGKRRRLPVEEFAVKLSDFFAQQWRDSRTPENHPPMDFLVGGFDRGEPYGRVFGFAIPNKTTPSEIHPGPDQFGMVWGGQKQFADRIIAGFDEQLVNVVQETLELTVEKRVELEKQFKERLQATIPFPFLPLQDSVDLSILLIRTTIAIQNWVVGVRGVGGPIDVATITRTGGFQPVQVKSISGDNLN